MKNLISFSIWGKEPNFVKGALINIEEAKEVYPEWICRFYVSDDISYKDVWTLQDAGAEVARIHEPYRGDWEGLFWRFYPVSEKGVNAVIIRDTDSVVNYREEAAVHEWLISGKPLHVMRDHIEHNVSILGGMWGMLGGIIPNIEEMINNWGRFNQKGLDQDFLRESIWKVFRSRCLCHDKYWNGVSQGSYTYNPINLFGNHDIKDFPYHPKIKYGTFVGERVI